jgi:hypothetical protein
MSHFIPCKKNFDKVNVAQLYFWRSVVFNDCHYPLFKIGTLNFLATFGGICGGCPIQSLNLVVLIIILKLTDKRRWLIVHREICFKAWWVIISSVEIKNYFKRSSLTIGLQITEHWF